MPDIRPVIAVLQLVHQPIGGVQSVMRELLPRLDDKFRIIVVDPYGNARFAEQCRAAGLETATLGPAPRTPYVGGKGTVQRPLRVLRRMPWMAVTLARFRRWVRANNVAIVWFNQLQAVRFFGRALPRRRPAILYHAHGFAAPEEIGARTAALLSRRARAVIAVSHDTARIVTEAGVARHKVHVIHNAIDADRVRSLAAADGPPLPPKPAGAVVFLHAATLNRHKKAQHLAIAALGLMHDSHAQLWICGDVGPEGDQSYLQELHQMARSSGLTERVHFLGWRKDLPRVIAQSDVVMLTSICPSESFGMILVEAMALGKPCMATNIGGPPEVIVHGETGLVIEPKPEAIAAGMENLAASAQQRARMGESGQRRADDVFSLGRQSKAFMQLLQDMVDRHSAEL